MSRGSRLVDVEVDGRLVDVRLAGGRVAEIGPGLAPRAGEDVVDGAGGTQLPGLHDHHVHLLARAARAGAVDLDPRPDPAAVAAALRDAAGRVGPGAGEAAGGAGWVRAGGYDEHRHGPLDRHRLDVVAPGVAVRVQHRSGLSWVLSSEALARLGLLGAPVDRPDGVDLDAAGEPTGWLHRLDGWLGARVPAEPPDLAPVGRALAALGITGVTDATAALGAARAGLLRAAVGAGALPQRLVVLGLDDPAEVEGWATLGPAKLLADESLGLDPDGLAARIVEVHAGGRAVAVHAVTRTENVAAVTALAAAGIRAGDRIEHGSVLPHDLDPLLAGTGATVVVQPSLVAERGDHHLRAVDPVDRPALHRHASLLAAGIRVGVGSDAPVTSPDPWAGIASAARRTTRAGAVVGPSEAVAPGVALGWYLADPGNPGGPPRRVEAGAEADLCLLDAPLAAVLADPDARHVRATWVGGRLVHG